MFRIHKNVCCVNRDIILDRVHSSLDLISDDVDVSTERVRYKISNFAPFIRYSRFAAFSQVIVIMRGDDYILELRPSAILGVPFMMACIAYIAFRTIGPISLPATLLIFSIPTALVVTATAESFIRTFFWWRSL